LRRKINNNRRTKYKEIPKIFWKLCPPRSTLAQKKDEKNAEHPANFSQHGILAMDVPQGPQLAVFYHKTLLVTCPTHIKLTSRITHIQDPVLFKLAMPRKNAKNHQTPPSCST
jgi:hypothetical protein